MATTQETTITDLELAEEVLGDMVLAVDTSTDTKSISLKQLKTYLGSNLPTGFILPAVGRTDDARFTLLDGKTLAKSGTYAEFCAKVEEQVSAGNWFSCTEEEFNDDVSKYGQCGRFVITTEYVRIPKITRFLGATVTLSEIGKTYAESLPNIKGSVSNGTYSAFWYKNTSSGAFNLDTEGNVANTATQAGGFKNFTLDASRSSEAYQDGAKVQPDHTRYPYYMVVSTEGQTAPISVDINKVYEDIEASLSTKANTDLSNISSNIDYVVEQGSNYMKFKSKKLICWGFTDNSKTIVLPKPYANADYIITACLAEKLDSYAPTATNRKTTQFDYYCISGRDGYWLTIGQGA